MARTILKITEQIQVWQITAQPGDIIKAYTLDVSDLLVAGENVASAAVDDSVTIPSATGTAQTVLVDILGPANGVQMPVRVTVRGTSDSLRKVALIVLGVDPFVKVVPTVPNIYLRWRGGWSPSETYLPYDLVLYGAVIYLALAGNLNTAPDIDAITWLPWGGSAGGGGISTGQVITADDGTIATNDDGSAITGG